MKDLAIRSADRGELLPLLKEAQARYGYLPSELMNDVARTLGLPVNEVYGVASFYSFLSTRPLGRHTLWICKCLPCHLKGGPDVLEALRLELGIAPGETTADGRFSLRHTNCIGACDQSPALMVNDDRYGHVGPTRVKEILSRYR